MDRSRLGELALLFLRLGSTVFGGPAAHLAVMEDEVVRRRRWLSREEFLDLVGATHLIPGPNSTEMAIHVGRRRAGWLGSVVAGLCFIVPASTIAAALGWGYVEFGGLPNVAGLLRGVRPVIVAVVVQALWSFTRTACRTRVLGLVGALVAALGFLGLHELILLFGTGTAVVGLHEMRRARGSDCSGPAARRSGLAVLAAMAPGGAAGGVGGVAGVAGAALVPFQLGTLFAVMLKTGAVLFGSGYVLLAFLRADLVDRYGWLTEAQLLDAVVVGQATPGPVFNTATFIGYLLGGGPGAVVATVGIFLPAFVFVALSGPLVPRLRASPRCGAFLDGVNVASLALMAVVTVRMGAGCLRDPFAIAIGAVAAFVLLRFRPNPTWLILAGAGLGVVAGAPVK